MGCRRSRSTRSAACTSTPRAIASSSASGASDVRARESRPNTYGTQRTSLTALSAVARATRSQMQVDGRVELLSETGELMGSAIWVYDDRRRKTIVINTLVVITAGKAA